jgi:hypothetical protein
MPPVAVEFEPTISAGERPTGHVMHQQFNIQQLYALPTLFYVFCIYLRTNSDLCHLQHKLIGFYNRDEVFTARYGLGL